MTSKATLYLLPVPLSDTTSPADIMPARNIVIARQVKHFIVENIRSARRFLKRCDSDIDIDSLTFSVLDEHSSPSDVDPMLEPLRRGEDMAIVSEAGCPAVADPGSMAVARAQELGIKVVPLIGPSSILMSLMASGFNGQQWTFRGYLPVEASARTAAIRAMEQQSRRFDQTQIFIETPYRNNRLIGELCAALQPSTLLCVASDITGEAEKIVTMPIERWRKTTCDYSRRPTIFLIYTPR